MAQKSGTMLDFVVGLLLLTNDGTTFPLNIGPSNYANNGLILSFQCSPSIGEVKQANVDDRHADGGPSPARSSISTWIIKKKLIYMIKKLIFFSTITSHFTLLYKNSKTFAWLLS